MLGITDTLLFLLDRFVYQGVFPSGLTNEGLALVNESEPILANLKMLGQVIDAIFTWQFTTILKVVVECLQQLVTDYKDTNQNVSK